MQDSIFLSKMDEWAYAPEGYYILGNDEVIRYGDKYFHYASEAWQPAGVFAGRKASTFGSAACRSKKSFKNVVTIE